MGILQNLGRSLVNTALPTYRPFLNFPRNARIAGTLAAGAVNNVIKPRAPLTTSASQTLNQDLNYARAATGQTSPVNPRQRTPDQKFTTHSLGQVNPAGRPGASVTPVPAPQGSSIQASFNSGPTSSPTPASTVYSGSDSRIQQMMQQTLDPANRGGSPSPAPTGNSNGGTTGTGFSGGSGNTNPTPASAGADAARARLEADRARVLGLSGMSEDERRISDELAQFQGDTRLKLAGLEPEAAERGINLGIVRGQEANLQEQAVLKEQTLLARLNAAQNARNSDLTAAQIALGYTQDDAKAAADAAAGSKPIEIDGNLVQLNPASGKYETVYQGQGQAPDQPATVQEYEYAKQNGFPGSFLEYQAAKQAATTSGGSGGDGFSLSPGQTRYDAYGNPIASAAGGELSATENKNLGFYNRALSAENDVQAILPDVSNFAQGALPNWLQGSDYQQYEQAARAWINAVLRQESGAAIPDSELKNYMQVYFPRVGDSTATIEQKARSRQEAISALNTSAGGGQNQDPLGLGFNSVPSTTQNGSIQLGSHLAQVNNNPGNLRFAGQAGATQGQGGFARFSSPQAGYNAVLNQITLDASRGHTLSSFISKYAPSSENNTAQYINQMVQWTGYPANTPLSKIDPNKLGAAMIRKESSSSFA